MLAGKTWLLILPKVYQGWRVLVGPEGLGDGPVAYGDAGFRVGPHINQLVTTMPRLCPGLLRLGWSVCTDTQSNRGSCLHTEQLEQRRIKRYL